MANRHAGALSEIGLLKESFEASEVGRQRSPDFEWFVASPLLIAGSIGDWDVAEPLRVLALRKGGLILSAIAELVEGFRNPTAEAKTRLLLRTEGELSRTGSIEIGQILFLHRLGMEEEAFDLLERASYSHMLTPNGRAADGRFLQGIIFGTLGASVRRDPRFVRLCDKLGLCRYWLATGRWPDCADDHQLPYDFRAEVRRIGAAA